MKHLNNSYKNCCHSSLSRETHLQLAFEELATMLKNIDYDYDGSGFVKYPEKFMKHLQETNDELYEDAQAQPLCIEEDFHDWLQIMITETKKEGV